MSLSRRDLLKAGAIGAGALALRPWHAFADALPWSDPGRTSRLFGGTRLAHADLHNHSLASDGDGDPALAFASMRAAGLDVAALTDHSTLAWGQPGSICLESQCQSVVGINEQSWAEAKALADAANQTGVFVAIRGFEWSSPTLGHMNVWLSERWMDPLHTAGGGTGEGAAQFAHDTFSAPAEQMAALDAIVRDAPHTGAGMEAFYEWLAASPSRPLWGGGADGIAGFNHPGREPGRFSNFRRLGVGPDLSRRLVSIEMFNRREDYLYEGTDSIARSPLVECLDAGWRVGITGVTDEHGTDWGEPEGKGRTGLWLNELSRPGVEEAMRARRFFATRERDLRVDAAANGIRMGGTLAHTAGPITFHLDLAKPAWTGKELVVQVLRSGAPMPSIQAEHVFAVPGDDDPVVAFTVDVDRADGDWIVLRVTDPSRPADGRADATWAAYGEAVAYASPFFLDP